MAAKRKTQGQPGRLAMSAEEVQRVLDLRRGSRTSPQGTGRRPQLGRRAAISESRAA